MNTIDLITICLFVGIILHLILGLLTSEFYTYHYDKYHQGWETWRIERNKPPQDRNYLRAKTAFNKIQDKHSWAHKYHDPDQIALFWPMVLLWYKRGKGVETSWYQESLKGVLQRYITRVRNCLN